MIIALKFYLNSTQRFIHLRWHFSKRCLSVPIY